MADRYVLNAPVLTSFGVFGFSPLRLDEAVAFLREPGWTSAVGHQGTADLLTQLSGVRVPVNVVRIAMEPGDQALVFQLLRRQRTGRDLTLRELQVIPHQYALLERLE